MTNETSVMEPRGLKVSDRCDACGAQAWVEVVMKTGTLLFCAHHARELKDSYSQTALEVHDYTDQLYSEAN